MESRLTKHTEKKIRRRFILTIIGSIVAIFVLIRFIFPWLISFSATGNKNTADNTNVSGSIVVPPVIITSLTATNSATIAVNGSSLKDQSIKLFVNNVFVDTTTAKNDGSFVFQTVALDEGANKIKVKAKKENTESDFSNEIIVVYRNKAPELTIDSPSDRQSFSKDSDSIIVKGKTEPGNKVTVNGFWAILKEDGTYTYTLRLTNGDNEITVVATDDASNKTEKKLIVNYAQ